MLHYKTIEGPSNNAPWIVMIHGAGGSSEVWYRQVAEFRRHYNLLLVDLMGHGGSMKLVLAKGYDFETAAEQVIEVVNHVGIDRAHYMGLSLGSIIVRFIAEAHPERVESMVLAGAVTQLNWETRTLLWLADLGKHIVPYRILKWLIAKAIIPQSRYGRSMKLFLENAKKVSFDNFLKWLLLGNRLNDRMTTLFGRAISIPTLYLMGADDYLFLEQAQWALNRGGGYASMVIIPDAGHVCNIDNRRFFNSVSLEWLQKIG
ncbi:MAG: alpha/beta hydrolase [Rikenellaceae bacterium]|nr:alpha/beta hydrolase [Rikenellaceae bacterium]